MPEETPPTSTPTPPPKPSAKNKMPEETPRTSTPTPPPKPSAKKRGGWFQKVPRDILVSPGGMILVLFAVIIEAIDLLLPFPIVEYLIEIPLEIIFLIFFILIVKPSIKSLIIPFIIERIPGISDILPTWLIKMFI